MHLQVNPGINHLAVKLLILVVVPGGRQHLFLTVVHLFAYRRQESVHIGIHAVDASSAQGGADGVTYLNQVIHHPLNLGSALNGLTVDNKDTVVTQVERVFPFVGQAVQRGTLPECAGNFIEVIGHPPFPHVVTHAAIDTFPDTLAGQHNDGHRGLAGQLLTQHVIERGHHLLVRAGKRRGFHNEARRAGIDENFILVVVIPVRQRSNQGRIVPGLGKVVAGRCCTVVLFPAFQHIHQAVDKTHFRPSAAARINSRRRSFSSFI